MLVTAVFLVSLTLRCSLFFLLFLSFDFSLLLFPFDGLLPDSGGGVSGGLPAMSFSFLFSFDLSDLAVGEAGGRDGRWEGGAGLSDLIWVEIRTRGSGDVDWEGFKTETVIWIS